MSRIYKLCSFRFATSFLIKNIRLSIVEGVAVVREISPNQIKCQFKNR